MKLHRGLHEQAAAAAHLLRRAQRDARPRPGATRQADVEHRRASLHDAYRPPAARRILCAAQARQGPGLAFASDPHARHRGRRRAGALRRHGHSRLVRIRPDGPGQRRTLRLVRHDERARLRRRRPRHPEHPVPGPTQGPGSALAPASRQATSTRSARVGPRPIGRTSSSARDSRRFTMRQRESTISSRPSTIATLGNPSAPATGSSSGIPG